MAKVHAVIVFSGGKYAETMEVVDAAMKAAEKVRGKLSPKTQVQELS